MTFSCEVADRQTDNAV